MSDIRYVSVKIEKDFTSKVEVSDPSEVLYENEHGYLVIGDRRFTTLQREHIGKKDDTQFHPIINKFHISDYTRESTTWVRLFGTFGISGYTSLGDKELEKALTKQFNGWLKKKVSAYAVPHKVEIMV